MTQFLESFRFDLTNTLSGHLEVTAHFFQRVRVAVVETEAHFEDVTLASRQGA